MTTMIPGSSGVTFGRKRWMPPAGVTTNFSKFHAIGPSAPSASFVCVRDAYRGAAPSPLTSILSKTGNVTPHVMEQYSRISSIVPGSCPMNWLQGKPSTVNPRSA